MISMNFLKFMLILNLFLTFVCVFGYKDNSNSNKSLIRKRRYVAFPEGSSISASLCTTIGAIGNPNVDFLSYALNWGVAYDLPNETWVIQASHGFKNHENKTEINKMNENDGNHNNENLMKELDKAKIQRRHRRDLYEKIEIAIDSMGFSGRDCILRTLCESSEYFFGKIGNMIEVLLKTIFSFPKQKVLFREHRDIHLYDKLYRKGRKLNKTDCLAMYPKCGFSLLELALGQHYFSPASSSSKLSTNYNFGM